MTDLQKMLLGYRLTLVEITYRLPDHPLLLQIFTWQTFDTDPDFPVLRKFLAFWEKEIEGQIHSVRICHRGIISPVEVRIHQGELRLN